MDYINLSGSKCSQNNLQKNISLWVCFEKYVQGQPLGIDAKQRPSQNRCLDKSTKNKWEYQATIINLKHITPKFDKCCCVGTYLHFQLTFFLLYDKNYISETCQNIWSTKIFSLCQFLLCMVDPVTVLLQTTQQLIHSTGKSR